jgi:acyl-CoA synthetase (AMP-forming)/AMP-acid ligase II
MLTLKIQDILKVSGAQVSPVEIENCLLEHPGKLINDVTVAGVSGGRISDEKVPRARIVLTPTGKKRGVAAVVRELNAWHQKNLSKYKWLRGGIQVVDQVCSPPASFFLYIHSFGLILFFFETDIIFLPRRLDPEITNR